MPAYRIGLVIVAPIRLSSLVGSNNACCAVLVPPRTPARNIFCAGSKLVLAPILASCFAPCLAASLAAVAVPPVKAISPAIAAASTGSPRSVLLLTSMPKIFLSSVNFGIAMS